MIAGNQDSTPPVGGHDGRPRCELCAEDGIAADHEWCPVAHSLVCDRCCKGVSDFEPGPLVAAMSHADAMMTPADVASVCADCPHKIEGEGVGDDEDEALPH
jgi:hypothetical protein